MSLRNVLGGFYTFYGIAWASKYFFSLNKVCSPCGTYLNNIPYYSLLLPMQNEFSSCGKAKTVFKKMFS